MLHISLFSGIGGFDLAAQWAGWENIVSCEINPFGNKVLNHYWPDGYHHTDIHTLTYNLINDELTKRKGKNWRTKDIILTGGFPCQPYSLAGKRLGKEDERHLWPEMLRIIREIQPKWIVGENVLGIVNWNGGLVFDEVQTDLETEGYEVQPYVFPAAAVNAPHRRDRVWFVARKNASNSNCNGLNQCNSNDEINTGQGRINALSNTDTGNEYGDAADTNITRCKNWDKQHRGESAQSGEGEYCTCRHSVGLDRNAADTEQQGLQRPSDSRKISRKKGIMGREGSKSTTEFTSINKESNAADTDNTGLQKRSITKWDDKKKRQEQSRPIKQFACNAWKTYSTDWRDFPTTEPTIRTRNDGISSRLDSITFSKWRNESIKAGGNAIVPQVAYQIFKAINEYEKQN